MSNQNTSGDFTSDVQNYIAEKTLPLTQRQLVFYQFGEKLKLPPHMGTTYTASRYDRLNLPYAPLQEGVPSVGEIMPLSQVSATAQQWGDSVYVTDVANLTIKHPLFQKAIELTAMQLAETLERNTINAVMAGTNVNFANGAANRAALASGDVMTNHEINRVVGDLVTIGAPSYMGPAEEDMKLAIGRGKVNPHYAAVVHPKVAMDLREDTTISSAWSRSDINKLYNAELGEFGGCRFTQSNMIPAFTGYATIAGTAGTAGSLATGTYYLQITGAPATTSVESSVYQVSAGIAVTGPNGSVSFTTPNVPGYVFNAYLATTSSPATLGKSTSGPTTGVMAGQAVQLPPNTAVVLTAIGAAQTPPAAPATGVTVYPTFFFGKDAYGQVELDRPKFEYLNKADKSDPHNQLRVVAWKVFYGTLIQNQSFMYRTEATSAFT